MWQMSDVTYAGAALDGAASSGAAATEASAFVTGPGDGLRGGWPPRKESHRPSKQLMQIQSISYAFYFRIFRTRRLPYESKMRTNTMRKLHSHSRSAAVRKCHAYERSEVSGIRKFSAYEIFWIYSMLKTQRCISTLQFIEQPSLVNYSKTIVESQIKFSWENDGEKDKERTLDCQSSGKFCTKVCIECTRPCWCRFTRTLHGCPSYKQ